MILLSTTVAGLVWCIGYMGCNFFRGTEDEYDRRLRELQEKNAAMKQRKQAQRNWENRTLDNAGCEEISREKMSLENLEKRIAN